MINLQFTKSNNILKDTIEIFSKNLYNITKPQFIINYLYNYDHDLLLKDWRQYENQKEYLIESKLKLSNYINNVLLRYKKRI